LRTPFGRKDTPHIFRQPERRDDEDVGQQPAARFGFGFGGRRFFAIIAPPEPGEHVEKLAAIKAQDGLHGAIQAPIGAAGNARLVLAIRTVKLKCPAHVWEIQLSLLPGNTGK
jgi:hypothetical protein